MLAEYYAEGTYKAVAEGLAVTEALKRLDATLARRGHQKLKAAILRALYRVAERGVKEDVPVVTLKREADAEKRKADIAAALKELGAEKKPRIEEDAHMIGGFTARYNGRALDNSYKTKLIALYRSSITKN